MMITAYVRYSLKYEHNAREMHVAKAKNKKEKKRERVTIIFCSKAELTQYRYAITMLPYLIG